MRKKGGVFSIVAFFSLALITAAAAPEARAAYPEPNRLIDMYHHGSPGAGPDLFVRSTADALARSGILKAKIQVQSRPGGSSASPALPSAWQARQSSWERPSSRASS